MVPPLARPPRDLNSFLGRKWLESITNQGGSVSGISGVDFLLLAFDATVPNARKLVGSANVTLTDGGAGGDLVLNLADSGIAAGSYTKITVNAKGLAIVGASADTGDITEGANLYFTNARVLALLQHRVLFDHYANIGNVGTGEDDLYSDTITAGRLANDGEKLIAQYQLTFASSGTATRQVKAYFGGTLVLDSGAQTFASGGTGRIEVTIIRESSSVVRVSAELTVSGITLQPVVTYTRITGLTLANTQVLKLTGEAAGIGAATDDIVANLGTVDWRAAA